MTYLCVGTRRLLLSPAIMRLSAREIRSQRFTKGRRSVKFFFIFIDQFLWPLQRNE